MNGRALASLLALSAITLAGCGGSAVIIARTPNGGVLSLEGDHADAMADARRQMSEACGGAYTIVGEHEAVSSALRGRTFTELEVEFRCGDEPAKPAPPPR